MSQAGARSGRGDEYQLRIATQWIVRLWTDPEVVAVQAESLGMPGDGAVPSVDDVVVELSDGRRIYVQAKKNHPDHGTWSLRDCGLLSELIKARDQLEQEGTGGGSIVRFYSRSPFGALHKLAEGSRDYPDEGAFSADAPATLRTELQTLAGIWDRSPVEAFALVRRMQFTVTPDYDEMDRDVLAALRAVFARPDEVRDLLEERLRSHQARLRDPVVVFRRADLGRMLSERGHVASPDRNEADQLATFARSSRIGRSWVRDVAGVRVERSETRAILDAVERGDRTILVTGEPGIGKTCVLLDVADALEQDPARALLFIKGDRFGEARTVAELVERGLPDDIVGRCARLAVHRPVVVVVDALDVLSLQRAGGTLELFLGLLDQLAAIQGVSIVAACRTFDLEYDPLLRGRTWDARITVGLLDVERDVVPILERMNVAPDRLDPDLLELLRVPGRLWLYGQVLGEDPIERVGSVYELHDHFLEDIDREPGWGAEAWDMLARVAGRMQERRTLEVSRAELRASTGVVRGLLSRGVLVETERGYAFGHQEIMDVVAVRAAQRRGERLRDFVAGRPALPFLRPTVRVFLHVLRAEDKTEYRREVRAFLSDEGIAYHLRRLVAETLAEIRPEAEDLPLLRRLLRSHGDLFERLLQRAVAQSWMKTVIDDLLPTAREGGDSERWTGRLLQHLAVYAAARPDVVFSTWKRALEEGWPGADSLDRVLAGSLEMGFREADRERIPWSDAEWLIRRLIQDPDQVRQAAYEVGPAVQAWGEAGGSDDVLLEFLNLEGTIDAPGSRPERRIRSFRRSEPSAIPTEFLAARMAASDSVIDAVLGYVLREAEDESRGYRRGILHETSWRARHSRGMGPHDAFNDVLDALEDALAERASRDDAWWRQHERTLLACDDGIRYLALQAIRRTPERHLETISVLLTDVETFEHGDLDSEISEIAHAAYPFLSAEVSKAHQAVLLSLGEPRKTDSEDWVRARSHIAYDHLIWIPRPYRTPEAEAFIATWQGEFGPYRREPGIYSSNGFVAPPISAGQIRELSDQGVLRVIGFWGTTVHGNHEGIVSIGGWDQVVGSISDAAMNVPLRALRWLDALIETDAPTPYRNACIYGVGLHLRVRFGRLSPSGTWDPAEPQPDGQALGGILLRLLERHSDSWIEENTLTDAVEACAYVLDDEDSAVRLTLLLERLGRSPKPDGSFDHKPSMEALNSTRGKAAIAAVLLAGRVAEAGRELPDLLPSLLHQFAGDARPGVRWAVLQGLPPLTQSKPDLAWALFAEATDGAGGAEWEVAEWTLYYNYHRHFDRVRPILDRIWATALDVAGRVYGRIWTLSLLSGHFSGAELQSMLAEAPPLVRVGVAEVFAANLGDTAHGARCEEEIVRLLGSPGIQDLAAEEVSKVLGRDATGTRVPRRVVDALVQGPPDREEYGIRVHSVLKWASKEVGKDALGVLGVLELLATARESGRIRGLYAGRELVSILTAVMREADETDDPALIARVVALQDRMLKLGVLEVERMLDAASRP
jgi:hypothetical protein